MNCLNVCSQHLFHSHVCVEQSLHLFSVISDLLFKLYLCLLDCVLVVAAVTYYFSAASINFALTSYFPGVLLSVQLSCQMENWACSGLVVANRHTLASAQIKNKLNRNRRL